MNIGESIREARKAKGIRICMLAKESGLSANMVSQVERGIKSPTWRTIEKLAGALGKEALITFKSL